MTTGRVWDSIEEGFWYAKETTVLYNTIVYTIGEKQIFPLRIKVKPELYKLIGQGEVKE